MTQFSTGDTESSPTSSVGSEVNIDKQRLGTIYAIALLGAADRRGAADATVSEFEAFVDEILQPFPAFEATLASPRISLEEKTRLIDRALGDRLSNQLLTFLKVVARHGRLDCLRQIRRAVVTELNQMRHRVTVSVITAEPLSNPLRSRIREQLQRRLQRDVVLECKIDPSILGGLLVRVGDTIFDGSIANQLSRLEHETLEKTVLQMREATERFAVSG